MTNTGDLTPVAPYELVERIRASINVLGPLLTRCGRVRLSMPGGDDFGARPIDMHVAGLEAMGAEFKFSHGELEATADRLHGADVDVRFPERRGDGEHRHRGGVRRRRDDDRQRRPGAGGRRPLRDVGRDGRRHLGHRHVHGWSCAASSRARCSPADHRTVPDRIQAATYLAAVAVAGGELTHPRRPARAHAEPARPLRRHGPRAVELGADAPGRRAATGCARSTCRRCRTRASPPTTSRCSSPCSASPTTSASSPRTSTRAASATSRS